MNELQSSPGPSASIAPDASSPDTLPKYWQAFRDKAPFVHPDDMVTLRHDHGERLNAAAGESFETFVQSKCLGIGENQFYFSLLPAPFAGDLSQADIFVLLLNPGFGGALDFYAEYCRPEWRQGMRRNLNQDLHGLEFPNLHLDPSFCWTGAFQWWERKLRPVAQEIAPKCGGYRGALRELAHRVASIELVPYHSTSFVAHKLVAALPSAQVARRYVRDVLLPRAQSGEITIIVTRQVAGWGLSDLGESSNVICYRGGQSRGASLGAGTPGGKAIIDQIARTGLRCSD